MAAAERSAAAALFVQSVAAKRGRRVARIAATALEQR
jgi:hypothetical protein